jgi:hypothetical protein
VAGRERAVGTQLARIEALRVQAVATAGAAVVKLNVGGSVFEVARSTLAAHPLSYFGHLLAAQPGPEGCLFVDRSPAVFDLVLQHLRGAELRGLLLTTERAKLELLLGEAVFFGLDPLAAQVREEL